MADEKHDAPRSIKPLAIGYLVWHCVSSLAILVILTFTTLAYAGVYSVQEDLPQTVTLMGWPISAWLFIVGSWIAMGLVLVAGVSFAVFALTAQNMPERFGRAIVLGRVMFCLCALDLVFCIIQGDPVSLVATIISASLTAALALEVRALSKAAAQSMPKKSFVAESIDEEPIREELLEGYVRSLFKATTGYCTIMLAWGVLRVVYGLSSLIALPLALGGREATFGLVSSLVIMAIGVYLILSGRSGKTALSGSGSLSRFLLMCKVGVIVSGGALALFVFLLLLGTAPTSGEVFCAVVDLALCFAGLFNGSRLCAELGA